MTGFVVQEIYTAGAFTGQQCMNLLFLGSLPATLTSLIKCIFFDSHIEYQIHGEQNSHTAKLKTWVSAALDEKATETACMDIDNVNLSSQEITELTDEQAQIKIDKTTHKIDNRIKQIDNMIKQQKSSKNGRQENAKSQFTQISKNKNNKKTGGWSTRQKKNNKQKDPKAEDAATTSGNGRRKKKNKNLNGKGTKNKTKLD